ncbi:DNA-binding response OmpR family regulator [Thermocatellispora tengchongensis]|uniref:DNA-binding response OmpR family regulator n=1 Tax=Thermocatellispora tengchongensis TaxID=1073253 RepID=A0A840P958_9ACTN|nr:hypothetical protein [Thermocatellispora tengchongensis]MBB5132525.1 DNA-binding response OmpR family regulator [Thermocatellispora tengchongensis]
MAADDRLTEPASPDEVARRLRDAHRRVRALGLPIDAKKRLVRRLLAICDVSKRDLQYAEPRLAAFLDDLARLESNTPGGQNNGPGD